MNTDNEPRFVTPQEDIDKCLWVENSVLPDEHAIYMDCMSGRTLKARLENPRLLDGVGRDVRNGCLLIMGVFLQCCHSAQERFEDKYEPWMKRHRKKRNANTTKPISHDQETVYVSVQ